MVRARLWAQMNYTTTTVLFTSTIYGGWEWEPSRSRVVVPARQATQADGIDSWAPKKIRILSLFGKANQTWWKERNYVFFYF